MMKSNFQLLFFGLYPYAGGLHEEEENRHNSLTEGNGFRQTVFL